MLTNPKKYLSGIELFIADAGFDSNENLPFTLCPLIKRGGNITNPVRLQHLEWFHLPHNQRKYRSRWKVEGTNSVIKRKFGETIYAKKESNKNKELSLKPLIYNIHRYWKLVKLIERRKGGN